MEQKMTLSVRAFNFFLFKNCKETPVIFHCDTIVLNLLLFYI
jgi:hypothetical protein